MKTLFAALLVAPLLIGFAPDAHASSQCRDFTKTTNYVNRTVTTSGTACLFADGAWHDVTTPGQPIVEYDSPVVVERPVYVERPVVYAEPVPVIYGSYGYYDHPHHYERYDRFDRYDRYNHGYGGRGGVGYNIDIRGRL